MVDLNSLRSSFQERYGKFPRIFSAPGRVNLIGEHTDYNEGFVLPMAVNRRTFVAAAARTDRTVQVRSRDFNAEASFNLQEEQSFSQKWLAYVGGVAKELERDGIPLKGSDLEIASDVPIGAGLSSSAALEISTGRSLLALANRELDLRALALAAQRAEHRYAGTRCGIMDQLTVALARNRHALLIDCRSLEVKFIELNLADIAVVICNTHVKHDLAASAYNQRRAECEKCVEILKRRLPAITALRDVSVADFERHAEELPEPLRRRCKHVVTENERTLQAATALQHGDVARLGELMIHSHESLRNDYEVSCAELDTMVELALNEDGVHGARMTGGGFGGCTVNLVENSKVECFCGAIPAAYRNISKIDPAIYVVEADTGVNEINAPCYSEQ